MKSIPWLPGRLMLMSAVSILGSAHAAFTYDEAGAMLYDGTVDGTPFTLSSDPNGDVNITGGGSLTVQNGTFNFNPNTSWGDKVGHTGSGSVTVNAGGVLNWTVDNDNEDRLMFGNGPGGNAVISLNGGDINVVGPGGYDHGERNVRFGSDGANSTLDLTSGDFSVDIDIPVAFGGKWTVGGTTFTSSAGSNLMNIQDGWFITTASSVFGVGATANLNFLSGATGGLSLLGWTEPQFAALATAGQLQIAGVDQTDLSGFSYSLVGGQGNLTLIPEPGAALLGGLAALGLLRRRRF